MALMALWFRVNHPPRQVAPAHESGFTPDELQCYVGGDFQALRRQAPGQGEEYVLIDGSALLMAKRLPINGEATRRMGLLLAGNVLVLSADEWALVRFPERERERS